MTKITNNRTIASVGIGGVLIEPGDTREADISASEARSHPFSREGWISVSGTPGRKSDKDDKPKSESKEATTPDGE